MMLPADVRRRPPKPVWVSEAMSNEMQSAERRSQPRSDVSCLVHVRRPEIVLAGSNASFAARNLSPDSLYFVAEDDTFNDKMHLLLTFPFIPDASAVQRECLVEIVRTDSLFRGRLGVAARLWTRSKLDFASTMG